MKAERCASSDSHSLAAGALRGRTVGPQAQDVRRNLCKRYINSELTCGGRKKQL